MLERVEGKMETLNLLIRQFEKNAEAFPGMTHVVMKWPKNTPKPPPPTGLEYDECNVCLTPAGDYRDIPFPPNNSVETAEVDVEISHWTIRPRDKSWDNRTAVRKLRALCEEAGRIYEKLRQPLIPSISFASIVFPTEIWLLALHELRLPEIIGGDILEFFYPKKTIEQFSEIYPFLPWFSVLRDVFLESALACGMLQDKVVQTGKPAEAEQAAKTRSWQEVSLDVIDDDTVRYKIGKGNWQRANYAELGFKHKLKGLPNKLWGIFKTLAENCNNKVIECHTSKNINKDIDRICRTLKAFFGPRDRPIRYNKRNKTWEVAFRLTFKSQDSKDS